MLLFGGALSIVGFALWIFSVIDVIITPTERVRTLPKLVWLIVVILLVDLGAIVWFIAGHPWGPATARETVPRRPSNPDDDEEFLASLSARNEAQRKAREADEDPPN